MKIDSKVINSRISKLREYIDILNDLKKEDYERFINDYKVYGLAERYLQLAIECVLDIGNHIISRLEYTKPETYQEILLILGKNSIIPEKFANKISKMAGFRNILIHNYLEIDRSLVYRFLQENIPDFERFIKMIVKFLDSF
ncbi:MAG: DUF86 domain-containing protein [Candidatus Lokiarchaeota archaeon]